MGNMANYAWFLHYGQLASLDDSFPMFFLWFSNGLLECNLYKPTSIVNQLWSTHPRDHPDARARGTTKCDPQNRRSVGSAARFGHSLANYACVDPERLMMACTHKYMLKYVRANVYM